MVAIPDHCQPVWAEHCNTIPYDLLPVHVHVHACTKPLYHIMYCMYMYMYMYMHVLNLYTISCTTCTCTHACTEPLYHIMYMYVLCSFINVHVHVYVIWHRQVHTCMCTCTLYCIILTGVYMIYYQTSV